MVSRPALWEFLLVTRFGENPIHFSSLNSTALKALYVKKSRTTVPAVQMGVGKEIRQSPVPLAGVQIGVVFCALQAVHLGTRYLVHEDMVNSTFGQILLLKDVCWLDLNASFHVGALMHCYCAMCNAVQWMSLPLSAFSMHVCM